MDTDRGKIEGVLILADESAEWRVAGLSQVDRLSLALNEYASSSNSLDRVPVCVHWTGNLHSSTGLPQDPRLVHLSITEDVEQFSAEMAKGDGDTLVLNTRLVVDREGFARFFESAQGEEEMPVRFLPAGEIYGDAGSYSPLMARITAAGPREKSLAEKPAAQKWFYLRDATEIRAAEKQLLLGTGKSQDGVIARFLNRPISRGVSRFFLRFPLSPNQWTIMATAIPIAGAVFLMRGDRLGFILGAILFQLLSVLDGCDGEIARLKYLESDAGAKLDGICDRLATMLLAVGLGLGLSRQPGITDTLRWFYPWEGIIAALLLGISETLLQRTPIDEDLQRAKPENNRYPAYVRTHRQTFNAGDQLKIWAIKNSGMLLFGEGVTSFFVQVTKRDVFNFAFALFILCGWPQSVLHILAVVAFAIAILAPRELLLTAAREIHRGRSHATASREEQLAAVKKKSAV